MMYATIKLQILSLAAKRISLNKQHKFTHSILKIVVKDLYYLKIIRFISKIICNLHHIKTHLSKVVQMLYIQLSILKYSKKDKQKD